MDSEKLISIVIPTRERAQTLPYTIRSALDQTSASYEVLVSDNYSQDNTREVVNSFKDTRLKYVNTGARLSMCDNWEFALKHTGGRYVIFVGDDDAVIPGAVDSFERIIRSRPYPAYMWLASIYIWPIDDKKPCARFLAPRQVSTILNLKRSALFAVRNGGWKYYEIPGVYHAAIERSVLEQIRNRAGRVFCTTQPDLFTSMAVPAFANEALRLERPVTVQGLSAKSNGGSSIAKDGAENVNRYIKEFGEYKIHESLCPELSLTGALLIDGIVQAVELFPEFYEKTPFNYTAMWAFLYRLNLVRRKDIVKARNEIRKHHAFGVGMFLYYCAIHDAATLRRSLLKKTMNMGPFARDVPDNIYDFSVRLAEWQNGFKRETVHAEAGRSC